MKSRKISEGGIRMGQTTFYVDKTTDTFADTLAAFGLAVVLQEILDRAAGRSRGQVQLQDDGAAYRLTCTPPIEEACLERAAQQLNGTFLPMLAAPVIRTQKNAAGLPPDLSPAAVVDYEAERDRNQLFWETLKQQPKVESGLLQPVLDWDIYRALNPAGLIAYNALMVQWWAARQALPDLLHLLLQMTAGTPNDVSGAEAGWKKLAKARGLPGKPQATASQIYNPGQGKGQNRAKADVLKMDNVDGFWLLEWLKAVGFYQAALTKQMKGSKDRKTYVLAPHAITLETHRAIMRAFRHTMLFSETATRSDILTILRYTLTFLAYCREHQTVDLYSQFMGGQPLDNTVSGFYVAFYKNLGQSAAVMNLSFINLPGWISSRSEQDLDDYAQLLKEHETLIRSLDETHSDAFDLLQRYRSFVTGNHLGSFLEFTTVYSDYLVSQRERRKYAPQFTIDSIRRLVKKMEPKLSDILDPQQHPGFERIAYAIRQSTVVAQYRKQQGDRRYDVRYGLGLELSRKAKYPKEFVTALSDFLQKFNAENAQVMESRPGPYRHSIQTGDIQDILALIDEHGSELICNLLVAYGYARSPREGGPAEKSRDPGHADEGGLESEADTTDETTE